MSASSPPSLPRAFLHSLYPHHPSLTSTPSPSPSPPGPLYTRLSNGSHSVPSPTNSRGSFHGVSFLLQIGLTRETVNLEASDLTLSSVKDLVCSIVDQKVGASSHMIHTKIIFLPCPLKWKAFPHTHAVVLQFACFQASAVIPKAVESHHEAPTCVLPSPTIFICLGLDIWASCPKMTQTPQKHAHNGAGAALVTAHSLVLPVIYIVVYSNNAELAWCK